MSTLRNNSASPGRRTFLSAPVVESSLALRHHQASVEVMDADGGGTRFVWTTDVLPDDVAPTVEVMMVEGAAAISRTIRR